LKRRRHLRIRRRPRFKISGVPDEDYKNWIRGQICAVIAHSRSPDYRCQLHTEPDHVRTRGASGADRQNLVPLCVYHHRQRHDIGIRTFEARHGINLVELALEYDARYTLKGHSL